MDTNCEEELDMTPEVRGEFEKMRRLSQDEHQQTRAMIAALGEKFHEHLKNSAVYQDRFDRHERHHCNVNRWKWALVASCIVTLLAAAAAVVTRLIK